MSTAQDRAPGSPSAPTLSIVIPLYRSRDSIEAVLREIDALNVPGGLEIVLVNDGSPDDTAAVCARLIPTLRTPVLYFEHTRNFGEHNAVLTGWRHARGRYFVNIDDDAQQPPTEALRLWQETELRGLDLCYGHYAHKCHSLWRNLGSWFTNRITDLALDKPKGFYLSSFRCVRADIAREAARHAGPYPYIDGLLLQLTQRLGSLAVEHRERAQGSSGYNLRRLIRLWMSSWINFSVLPLRIATVLGLALAVLGLTAIVVVFALWLTDTGPFFGWGSLMAALLLFSGTQLMMLGVIGEYLGRMFQTLNQRPQSAVRLSYEHRP